MGAQAIEWFEIPTTNINRAVAFYEALGVRLKRVMCGGRPAAIVVAGEDGVGGALIEQAAAAAPAGEGGHRQSAQGAVVTFEGSIHSASPAMASELCAAVPLELPSRTQFVVYFGVRLDLDGCLERAVHAGGTILLPKTDVGVTTPSFIAILADTEGNRIGLHSQV
jgi:predicted enzyme related to lactoylglutathione lyase